MMIYPSVCCFIAEKHCFSSEKLHDRKLKLPLEKARALQSQYESTAIAR